MQPLTIVQTEATPYVYLDNARGTVDIKGNSFDEDAVNFYRPILDWLDLYKQEPKKETVLTIELKYFNTSSAKCLYEVLDRFADLRDKGFSTIVNWYYLKDDAEMKQEIQGFSHLIEMPFNIKELG